MDAKARREARKARILGAGQDRLARITKTGRGGEAEALYADHKRLGRTAAAVTPADTDDDEVLRRANNAMRGGTGLEDDDPQDVDISKHPGNVSQQGVDPFMTMMQQRQQQAGLTPEQQAQMPQDIQGFMRAMQQAMGGGGGAGIPPGVDTGDAQAGMPTFPFGNFGAGGQQVAVEPAAPSLLDAVFNILRVFVVAAFGVALTYGALRSGRAEASSIVSETAGAEVIDKFDHMSTLHRWARLAYERPAHWEARYFGIESFGLSSSLQSVPVFWILITLEIGLASMRIMLQRRRPQPPGILLKVAAFIPSASIQLLLRTLAAYLPLVDAFINDLALVVFAIGCTIMFAAWKVGLDPLQIPAADGGSIYGKLGASAQDVLGQVGEMAGAINVAPM
jgi:hypothetical protein